MTQTVGILAYGSLMANPGTEIERATVETKEGITTPFNVEFARSSSKRRGAPTLVPVTDHGAPVHAQILVLDVSETEATNRLYRREIDKIGSNRTYKAPEKPGENTVIIKRLDNFAGIDVVLYTEIAANISPLSAEELAKRAINSAKGSDDGRDGISYLIDAIKHGVKTPLSAAYEEEIKKQLQPRNLNEVLRAARMADAQLAAEDLVIAG